MAENKPAEKNPHGLKGKPSNGRNSPVIGNNGIHTEPGDNARYASIIAEIMTWPEVDRHDVGALQKRMEEYVNFCAKHDLKMGNQMCYLALGISKDDVYDWEHGRSLTSAHSDFIKKVKKICAGNRELLMQDGKVNNIIGIFWQKNYDGMKDQQEMILTPNQPLGQELPREEIINALPQIEDNSDD